MKYFNQDPSNASIIRQRYSALKHLLEHILVQLIFMEPNFSKPRRRILNSIHYADMVISKECVDAAKEDSVCITFQEQIAHLALLQRRVLMPLKRCNASNALLIFIVSMESECISFVQIVISNERVFTTMLLVIVLSAVMQDSVANTIKSKEAVKCVHQKNVVFITKSTHRVFIAALSAFVSMAR